VSASQQDQRVAARRAAGTERRKGLTRRDWKLRQKVFTGELQHRSMVPRLSQQQDRATDVRIALLEEHPADDGLKIADVGLGINPRVPTRPVDRRVPGATVDDTGHGQLNDRNFDPPLESRLDSRAQALKQPKLRHISNRWASWVCPR
jgi:hypothetical protein